MKQLHSLNWARVLCEQPPSIFALVTIIDTNGSTPCTAGSKLVVDRDKLIWGTIGGGKLEQLIVNKAQQLLSYANFHPVIEEFALSTAFSQCCGGTLQVCIEPIDTNAEHDWLLQLKSIADTNAFTNTSLQNPEKKDVDAMVLVSDLTSESSNEQAHKQTKHLIVANAPDHSLPTDLPEALLNAANRFIDSHYYRNEFLFLNKKNYLLEYFRLSSIPQVVVYGAGHVAQSLLPIICQLPIAVTWIDSRPQQFTTIINRYENLRIVCSDFLEAASPPIDNAYHLIMTFSHEIDYKVCSAILQRNQFAWVGMIGSKIKGKRFKHRLARENFDDDAIARFHCPIGQNFKNFKSPIAVATAIAAELIHQLDT